jgi:hypothetical protein
MSESEWSKGRPSVPVIMTSQPSEVEAFSGLSKHFFGF